jgi:hypothetical protein
MSICTGQQFDDPDNNRHTIAYVSAPGDDYYGVEDGRGNIVDDHGNVVVQVLYGAFNAEQAILRVTACADSVCYTACACPSDFNCDGDIGTDADLEAFFDCLLNGHCPACRTADVDMDGDIGTDADIEYFFARMADNCPPQPCQ